MAGMVDIHCHVLPAVDDGSTSIQMSLNMLRCGLAEGITGAVLTPHIHPFDGPDKEALHQERFADLKEAVAQAGLEVEISLGAEMGFRFGLAEVAGWPSGTLGGNGTYVLVDLPPGILSPGLERGFFSLRTAGFKPILAHPERHRQLARSHEQIGRLRQQELLFQVNAGSILGQFGRRAQRTAEMLLHQGWVEFVASDGHDLGKRPFSLVAARARVEELCGGREARRLFVENPGRVRRGEGIEGADASFPRPLQSPGLLKRLLGAKR